MSSRRRQSQDFSESIRSFILNESKRSNVSTLSKGSDSDNNLLNRTADLTQEGEKVRNESQLTTDSFQTASSQKWSSLSQTSMEKDSLENVSQEDTSFKNHVKESIYRRLSYQFQKKPIDFTRKLVSILEESCAQHSLAEDHKTSEVSLDKIADEFIKLCKFIEDESMPDLAVTMTPSPQKKGFFRNIPENKMSPRYPGGLANDTCTFEYLEKFCDDFYQEEELKTKPMIQKPALNSSGSSIYTICEQQMASLSDEDTIGAKKDDSITTTYFTPEESFLDKPVYDANEMEESIQDEIMRYKQRCMQLAKQMSEIEKEGVEENEHNESLKTTYFLETINRCLEYKNVLANQTIQSKKTEVKRTPNKPSVQMKKTETSKIPARKTPAKLSVPSTLTSRVDHWPAKENKVGLIDFRSPVVKKATPGKKDNFGSQKETLIDFRSPVVKKATPGKKLLSVSNTLSTRVEHWPAKENKAELIDLRSPAVKKATPGKRESFGSQKETLIDLRSPVVKKATPGKKEILGEKKETLGVTPKPIAKSPLRTFFVTPGKSGEVKKIVKKKNFFTDPADGSKERIDLENKKTPNSVQKLKYQNVVSPLSKYINYKSSDLMQNVHAVTNDMMLTPKKGDPTDKLKIPLSPKVPLSPKTQITGRENKDPSFPRVYYNCPDEVKVVKHSPKMFPCRGVLESINNKVVIKHIGRVQNQAEGTEMSVLEEKQAF